jgi:hypothetical protein
MFNNCPSSKTNNVFQNNKSLTNFPQASPITTNVESLKRAIWTKATLELGWVPLQSYQADHMHQATLWITFSSAPCQISSPDCPSTFLFTTLTKTDQDGSSASTSWNRCWRLCARGGAQHLPRPFSSYGVSMPVAISVWKALVRTLSRKPV